MDPPYEGALGRTRTEPVQVWMPDGAIRVVRVHVGVDAASDPALANLARAGTLHQVAEGVELAIPFIYHDPAAHLFVLVVPEPLRHRALALRADHMAAVAADPAHVVPDYVRDVEVVIGSRGLCARLGSGPTLSLPLVGDPLAVGERMRALADRERTLAQRQRVLDAREEALRHREGAGIYAQVVRSTPRVGPPSLGVVYDSELEEVDLVDPQLYELAVRAGAAVADDVEEIGDDDGDVEELPDEEDIDAGLPRFARVPSVPPERLAPEALQQLSMSASEGRVWIFVRGRPNPPRDAAEMELLVQLDPEADVPVVLLTLVLDVEGAPEVRRGVVDPKDPAQAAALGLLAEHFEVELVSIAGPGEREHWARLRGACEANVRSILEWAAAMEAPSPERFVQACEALLTSPPPWRDLSQPFVDEPPSPAQNATEAAVQLDELADWLQPKRLARVRLLLCVPDELIDERCRAVIGQALDWGLSLPAPVAARALELGVAQDERSMLQRRIEGLCRTSRAVDFAGLEESVLRAQWSEALEQAAHLGVSLSEEARDLAREHAGERALVHASALADSQDAALAPIRDKALAQPPDPDALGELIARGGHRDLLAACRATETLEPEAAGELFARLAGRKDPAAVDALLSLLAPSEGVRLRVGAALALAQRRAVLAIDDLCTHVASEAEPVWRVFALALGRFGGGSFRAIARSLAAAQAPSERMVTVYAHLAAHGARAQVRAKTRSRIEDEAALARRALSLADELKGDGKDLVTLEQQGPLTVFCERFDRFCADAHR